MQFKDNKWYNLGDINPREHGGVFVKRDGDYIDVIQTDNLEDSGGKGYRLQERGDFASHLKSKYDYFKKNPDKKCQETGVGRFADWKRFIQMEKDGVSLDDIVFYLAADMISYYGGDCEHQDSTNYWELVGMHGITCRNYS